MSWVIINSRFFFLLRRPQVGAPPEVAGLLDEIRRQSDDVSMVSGSVTNCLGSDPELDEFMVSLSPLPPLSKFLLVLTETLVNFTQILSVFLLSDMVAPVWFSFLVLYPSFRSSSSFIFSRRNLTIFI